ncbi:MAG: glycerol-3-phosphate 1-O-acyltransferase PlsY [Gammaproteobacteria bacterium]|nr:glycerol-3-phosphate 1-O-acyltransferase PlsY [Gammaproteobacteria bacterium]MCY4274810.1 glycerol-3-phosphate 1-O-acyltransferase PlsY [Gammaproteobacteria bacterium]
MDYTLPIFAYFIGSISCSVLICKLTGLPDPRQTGSNNPGATNVLRIGGKQVAALTLSGDVLKGSLPIILASLITHDTLILSLVGVFAFLGHLYPIFFQFQGGKGVATAIGVYLALSWPVALILIGIWLITAFMFRYSSVASLTSAIIAPILIAIFTKDNSLTLSCILIALLIIFRHRANLLRLMKGTESKIKLKRS